MKKQPKIMTRLILTYTLVLSFFAIVVLIIFFSLFNQQAHVIHGEKMKEQGDKIAEILVKDNYLEEEKNEEDNLSHHEKMMKRNNHMSNTTDYLSLISQLSTDEIYVVNETGEFLSTSHMTKKQQNTLTDSGNTILNELKQNKQATFFEKNSLPDKSQLGYGVPILNSNQELLGAVILLSNKDNYFLGLGKDYQLLIWSVLIALIVTIFISIIIAKRFVKPIHQMSVFTEELIQMNYDANLTINTKDELAELGNKLSVLSDRLKKAQKEQDNKEHNQKLFLSQISHELRTPVMVIQNSLEALAGDFLDEVEKENYIKQLLLETKELNLLVNDLLELSRLQITEFSIEKEAVDFNQVIQDSLRSYRPLLIEEKREIIFNNQLTDVKIMTGDYHRLLQLTKILVDNSLKYSLEKSAIRINLLEKNNHLVLEVINELPKNAENFNTETVFESFNRGNQRDNKGHGLGLTIASQIVSRHHGEIKMDYLSSDKIKVSVLFPE
ncbi:HAMP domain-containing histidine kinase [Vagococcus fluvialis]|uniref:sensor histidine kinase n=1 Tax=Vagococcus fluvialis TaxID=2738 RepID=UPI001A8C6FF2|nr:HAMP domain-containing sensor histidine kinase [Vagococcus fluvialis]MBO0429222.1 HAMP domain-containing histidine kinase [Vagococcus fluvialis]